MTFIGRELQMLDSRSRKPLVVGHPVFLMSLSTIPFHCCEFAILVSEVVFL